MDGIGDGVESHVYLWTSKWDEGIAIAEAERGNIVSRFRWCTISE